MALNQLNVTTTVLTMISGAVLLIIIISSMLALKDFIPNLIAGIYIHKKKFIKQGDKIQFKNISGIVLEINLVETKIQMKNKDIVFIPNSQLTKQEIIRKN